MTKSRLDAQTDLLLLECLPIGYNRDFTAWIVGPDGTPKPAPLGKLDPSIVSAVSVTTPKQAQGSVWLTSPSFKAGLHTTFCARAFCDAGTEVAYRWTEGELRVHRIWQRDDDRADSIESGTWPIVWPSSDACAYRWRVEGDAVSLVAITPKAEKSHRLSGLPGPCEGDETVLSCAPFDVLVTSKGADWIIWLSPTDSESEPASPLIVWKRIRRGCDLQLAP